MTDDKGQTEKTAPTGTDTFDVPVKQTAPQAKPPAAQPVKIVVIDPSHVRELKVKDLVLRVRLPNLAQRLSFVAAMGDEGNFKTIDWKKLISAAADCIVSIDAWEDYEPEDVLQGIQNAQDLLAIVRGLRALSEVTEEQAKK